MPNKEVAKSYSTLLTQIKYTIESGRKALELTKARAYWHIGEHISKHLLSQNGRASYGEKLYKHLAKDLKIDLKTLQRSVQFYKTFPKGAARHQLNWGHYRSLITIDNPLLRNRLLKRAEKNNLTTRELAREIQQTPKNLKSSNPPILNPNKGPLNIHQTISSKLVTLQKGQTLIDCGFNVWKAIKRSELKSGKLVKTRAEMSFTYKATVQKIIDGDTLWVIVDLRLGSYTRQKLRLRGIDTPEIKTAAGKRAKEFVEKALTGLNEIIIYTTKPDKFDRYLADIFYGKEGTFLNQQLLDAGLADYYG